MPYFGTPCSCIQWEALKDLKLRGANIVNKKKMLSTGCAEYTTIIHLGLTANRLLTSNAARAFFSRTVKLWRSLVERMRFPITSSMSRASSCCCTVRTIRTLSLAGRKGLAE
jgi:hypothetical protein